MKGGIIDVDVHLEGERKRVTIIIIMNTSAMLVYPTTTS